MKYKFEVEVFSKDNVEWLDILSMLTGSEHFKRMGCYSASVKPLSKVDED